MASYRPRSADHPHTRGENEAPLCFMATDNGPSPHAWGERCETQLPRWTIRTIPTRVGRTLDIRPRAGRSRTIPTRVGRTLTFKGLSS